LTVYHDGTVRFASKFNLRLTASYDFARFPLDRQRLRIPLQALLTQSEHLEFGGEESLIGFDNSFQIPEWRFVDFETRVEDLATRQGQRYSQLVLELEIARYAGFYFWKIAVPLVIIMCVSFSVFWMTRDVLAQRQRQAATGVLTLVAFQFVALAGIPRVPYLTLLDVVFVWSFLVCAATLAFNVRNHRRIREDLELGLKADRACRVGFPGTYVAGLVVIVLARYLL
jgi:hypothetical protein